MDHSVRGSNKRRYSVGLAAALLTLIWLLLSDFDLASLMVGIPSIGVALWCHQALRSSDGRLLSFAGTARLAGYFIRQSLSGGWDLARRSCGRRLNVKPGLIEYSRHFTNPSAYPLFVRCLNLLPGTLSVEERQGMLLLHVIDTDVDYTSELDHLGQLTEAVWRNPGGSDS
ncbi:Na+/H+ antiporter subunit E [Motiliproteus sp.]|uniref:Na+/H+ antiporter subunit E n=1 Tax=Motiliproteus sp. TaxID=1898955 RepID=UPI003BA93337